MGSWLLGVRLAAIWLCTAITCASGALPRGWWLPGSYRTDWLAAAMFDTSVGNSLFTGQFTHRIAEDTDAERDYVVATFRRGPRPASS